jgi:hypothetical protein
LSAALRVDIGFTCRDLVDDNYLGRSTTTILAG